MKAGQQWTRMLSECIAKIYLLAAGKQIARTYGNVAWWSAVLEGEDVAAGVIVATKELTLPIVAAYDC
jgi:hypothetical protein